MCGRATAHSGLPPPVRACGTPLITKEITMRIPQPSPAMVVACVALAVAVGGTATAARTLVRSKDIAPGAVKARNIASGAIQTRNIANGAVTAPKLSPGVLSPSVSGSPSGTAGGALAGTYPNPGLSAGSVGTAELQAGAVTAERIATGAIAQASQIADGAIPLTGLRGAPWGISMVWGDIQANACKAFSWSEPPGAPVTIKAGDLLLPGVSPSFPPGIFGVPTVAPANDRGTLLLCNGTTGLINLGPGIVQVNYKVVR
jgi:hypothetical protein